MKPTAKKPYVAPTVKDRPMDLLCSDPDCENEATSRYTWPWGDEGFCCDDHRVIVAQHALQLNREVTFVPLYAPPSPEAKDAITELAQTKENVLLLEQLLRDANEKIRRLEEHNAELVDQVGVSNT